MDTWIWTTDLVNLAKWPDKVAWQSQDHPRLARTMGDQRHSIIPWLCQLLQAVHLQLFRNHGSAYPTHMERHHMEFHTRMLLHFQTSQESIPSTPILMHWIPDQPLVVKTDTLDYVLVAILSRHALDGELHPIAFHSCIFSGTELNHDIHDKELLATYKAFWLWQHYLEELASPMNVVTNHKIWSIFDKETFNPTTGMMVQILS